jgi:hypothetical protein
MFALLLYAFSNFPVKTDNGTEGFNELNLNTLRCPEEQK